MHKRIATGLFVLIFILGVAIVFYHQYTDIQQLKQEAAETEKLLEEQHKGVAENDLPPAPSGYKWVPHGDHHHLVPIDAPDVWQGEPHEPVAKEVQAKPTYTGPLTYHEELLKTNPVKALRLQQEERGHWSAKWIPPFPPDDFEAASLARYEYLSHYYKSIGETGSPKWEKVVSESVSLLRAIMEHPHGARRSDLLRLTWSHLPPDSVSAKAPYYTPSDYFIHPKLRGLQKPLKAKGDN
ncbi:MAG: hypothetical protein OXM61_02900 [Candidatus Poribacteria bacterium]|nr:hypothetical protein [Candidatus Poribacteria bacterium]